MSLRASLLFVNFVCLPQTFLRLDATIRASEQREISVAEDQELPMPRSSDMELPPPLPKPEIISSSNASGVIDPESIRIRSQSNKRDVWVGAKLSNVRPQVLSIVAKSPAAIAGLNVGDVVDSVSYRRVTTTPDVVKVLQQNRPGDVVDFIVVRKNTRYLYRVKLSQPPSK